MNPYVQIAIAFALYVLMISLVGAFVNQMLL